MKRIILKMIKTDDDFSEIKEKCLSLRFLGL